MSDIAQTIMREIESLPENRLANILAYVRFIKLGLDLDEKEIEERFERSWEQVRARAKKLNITPEDIEAEIRAVREGK